MFDFSPVLRTIVTFYLMAAIVGLIWLAWFFWRTR